ncbi:MAG TPA: CHAT domain-containing protein [Actinocrinis sp.]|uniref:CHAT domain-containing tetratricopeptide repeat protein n=1 Tax=Actinocrinis sp. TaxID=1920516 RepID=UPI002DDD4741|nr:CHAT domain-containing protein [Actinocrinis sp.]HEV2347533.1 CHAT domain-containing protein [Actinocrinis sp.]
MELFPALTACLAEVYATGNPALVLEPGVVEEARHLAGSRDADPGIDPVGARHVLGWFHWFRYQALPQGRCQEALDQARSYFLEYFVYEGTKQLPEELRVELAMKATLSAYEHQRRTLAAPDPLSVEVGVRLWTRIAEALAEYGDMQALCLMGLSTMLQVRCRLTGDLEDLDEAIRASREAVALCRESGDDKGPVAGALSTLSTALRDRFGLAGALGDLEGAVEFAKQTVRSAVRDPENMPGYLSNLGTVLTIRFERTGAPADLDEAIQVDRLAVETTSEGHPDRAARLSNLSFALQRRYTSTADPRDLDEAIASSRQAVAATDPHHRDWTTRLAVLGSGLRRRYERTAGARDGDEAIQIAERVAQATGERQPDSASRLHELGVSLVARYRNTRDLADVVRASEAFAAAVDAENAPASARIQSAGIAAGLIEPLDTSRAAALLEQAVRLLPEVTPRRLLRSDKQYALSDFTGLAGDAAALALSDTATSPEQRGRRALSLLESGRTVLLSQMLDNRGSLADLHPDLAARFTALRDRLDRDDASDLSSDSASGGLQKSEDRVALARELAAVLGEIRSRKGFESFGLPPSLPELLPEAARGPVVSFSVSSYRSDALLLTADGVQVLPLPGLEPESLNARVGAFHAALVATTDPEQDRGIAQAVLAETLEWLWDTVAEPVLNALGYGSAPENGADWPHIWWAPGGLLGLLPLHAAGRHTEDGVRHRRSVMDRVISSYTPTVRALRHAREREAAVPSVPSSLIVAMPTTPGLPGGGRLAHVPAEVETLRTLLPNPLVLDQPTRARVLDQLPRHTIAHFACHGANDPADPSRSRLILHDHQAAPLTVAALAPIDLNHARLAYLSACDTALSTAAGLLDEAIHLTSAFQLAGYAHVVGTLWAIDDEIAVEIAEDFYAGIHDEPTGGLDFGSAARALHHATRTQRDLYPRTPSLWAAHVHAGA